MNGNHCGPVARTEPHPTILRVLNLITLVLVLGLMTVIMTIVMMTMVMIPQWFPLFVGFTECYHLTV